MDKLTATITARLKSLRSSADYTQNEVAEILGKVKFCYSYNPLFSIPNE